MNLLDLRILIESARHIIQTGTKEAGDRAELTLFRTTLEEIAAGEAINPRLWAEDALTSRKAKGPTKKSRLQIVPCLNPGEQRLP